MRPRPGGVKRKHVFEDFAIRDGDADIVRAILGRGPLDIMHEMARLAPPQFEQMKGFINRQTSLPRVIDHLIAHDQQLKALEVWGRKNPTWADPDLPRHPPKTIYTGASPRKYLHTPAPESIYIPSSLCKLVWGPTHESTYIPPPPMQFTSRGNHVNCKTGFLHANSLRQRGDLHGFGGPSIAKRAFYM